MAAPIVVTDRPERRVEILVGLDDVVVTYSRYATGERGPEPHVHLLHADCFYILEGAFTLSLDNGERVLGPGTFGVVPPNVVHAFRNDGPGEVRFLNIHAPGVGFDRYVLAIGGTGEAFREELAARYDQHPPPDAGGRGPSTVIVRTPETFDSVTLAGNSIAFLGEKDELLGVAGIIEYTAAPGSPGPPLHVHDGMFDIFIVIEGKLDLRCGGERLALCAGEVAVASPGTAHTFANALETPTRFLDSHAPAGFEQYFRDAAALGDGPRDPAAIGAIAARYDMRNVG